MQNILKLLHNKWHEECGYRDLLKLAFPLVLSMGAISIQHFVDRMFLTWYSPEAIAAVTPSGMLNFTLLSFFIGTAMYVNTFVAQYYGSEQFERIGPSLWQGIYFAIIGGIVLLIMVPYSEVIFKSVGHEDIVRLYETQYFRILCYGAAPAIASTVFSSFYSGRGATWTVMFVNICATSINIMLDYLLIFGNNGFPELGIRGAAIATIISYCVSFGIFFILVMQRSNREKYQTAQGWMFDRGLFMRMVRFGVPNGIQFFLEIAGLTIFIILIGRLGTPYLAATNIAFNINTIAFLPMFGMGMAIMIVVGQHIGKNRPDLAEKSVYTGLQLTLAYTGILTAMYVLIPGLFLAPYASMADSARFEFIRSITVVLLRFVAFYSLFDALNIVFAYAIKGAGDTQFVMKVIILDTIFVLVLPSYIALEIFNMNIYIGWIFLTAFVVVLGLTFYFRFKGGKWKTMSVIDTPAPLIPSTLPDTPILD
ncbi:MATE family efflux transporter [Candidatus Latescibacterota bacterium]